MGWTLADVPSRVSWRAVKVLVAYADRASSLAQIAEPVRTRWSDAEYMQAVSVDLLQLLVWMQSKDGHQNRRRPIPLPRPGDAPRTERFGDASMTIAEAEEFLKRRQREATCARRGCGKPIHAKHLCSTHYRQARRSAA